MLNATLIKRENVTKDLAIFHVKPDREIPTFLPGQYVALGLYGSAPRPSDFPPEKRAPHPEKIIKRAYSIGSSPEERGHLEFYLAILPEGLLTSRLALLREGDRLFMAPKIVGTFTLDGVPDECHLVFVATGTGIAPFISMLRAAPVWTAKRRITLLHGVRYEADLAYRQELTALAASRSAFDYRCILSRETPPWGGVKGYVQSFVEGGVIELDPAKDHVFLCGNPGMIDGMEALLKNRGYTISSRKKPGNLHLERYW